MLIVIGIAIGLAAGASLAFLSLYALTGSRLAAARRTRQLLVRAGQRDAEALPARGAGHGGGGGSRAAGARGGGAERGAGGPAAGGRAQRGEEVPARRAETIKIEE